jgi:hypothetical protein
MEFQLALRPRLRVGLVCEDPPKFYFVNKHRLASKLEHYRRLRPAECREEPIELLRWASSFQVDEQQPPVAVEQVAVDLPVRFCL